MAEDRDDVQMRDASTSSAMDIASLVNPTDSEAPSSSSPSTTATTKASASASASLTSKSEDSRTRALLEEKFADQVRDLKQKLDRISKPEEDTGKTKLAISSLVNDDDSGEVKGENPFLSLSTSSKGKAPEREGKGLSSFAELLASLNEEMANQPDDVVQEAGEAVEDLLKGTSLRDKGKGRDEEMQEGEVEGEVEGKGKER